VIRLEDHAEGVVLPVRARPGARADAIRREWQGALEVRVTQAPEKGKANAAIAALLARELGLKRSQLVLLSGKTSPHKRFLVRGAARAELAAAIAAALAA
jgi:uncharacterized protein (TIGR00251 family)